MTSINSPSTSSNNNCNDIDVDVTAANASLEAQNAATVNNKKGHR